MKAKDQVRLDVLRAMKSALKYKFVEKKQQDLTEEEAIAVFQTMIKQRKDSAEQFEKFSRPDQANKEKREVEVIMSFLPKQLSSDEVKSLVTEAIAISQAQSLKDLGKVMKELKPKISGRADAKEVTELVKQLLPAS